MAIKTILQLGNPQLLEKSTPVDEPEINRFREIGLDLRDTMRQFRAEHNRGRAIAAPQIGVMKQIVYSEFCGKPEWLINPILSECSSEMIELWDDCMSFPHLKVKVRRHQSCRVTYRDENWQLHSRIISGDESELLQHEIDHLHGILATMRAIDENSIQGIR